MEFGTWVACDRAYVRAMVTVHMETKYCVVPTILLTSKYLRRLKNINIVFKKNI